MNKIFKIVFVLIVCFSIQKSCQAQVFNLGNTVITPGWYKLGRLYLPQQGYDAQLHILAGTGYNAVIDQMAECIIHFRTSNASSQVNNFYAAGTFYNTGRARIINGIRVVQVTADTWDFYADLPTFTGDGGTVILQSASGNWTPGFLQSNPPPAAIFSDLTEEWFQNSNSYFSGNVGIGTSDPKGYKLAVAGNMIAESVKVQLRSAWPDYVFKDDYKLPTLQETEKHIKEKGHLPGIPSAAEVKLEGIDLGEMNKKLVQKIEELTLYILEQNKRIEKLEHKK